MMKQIVRENHESSEGLDLTGKEREQYEREQTEKKKVEATKNNFPLLHYLDSGQIYDTRKIFKKSVELPQVGLEVWIVKCINLNHMKLLDLQKWPLHMVQPKINICIVNALLQTSPFSSSQQYLNMLENRHCRVPLKRPWDFLGLHCQLWVEQSPAVRVYPLAQGSSSALL